MGRPVRRAPAPVTRRDWARRLVIMLKAPVAGRVKTRIAHEAGVVHATGFSRRVTAALLDRVGRDLRWRTILAVTPDRDVRGRFWPRRFLRRAQGGGDLGRRMQRVMDGLPPGPVVIVGSDIPALGAAHIALAFKALGRHDAVCGPAPDGGYWLIGLRRSPRVPRVFANVRWSSSRALSDTLANLSTSRVVLLSELDDVDQAADLVTWNAVAGRRIAHGGGARRETEMDRLEPETNGQTPPSVPAAAGPATTADATPPRSSMAAHYSPAQVLQSGRRAEAGGHPDYAIQFYRHLTEYYPGTSEGKEARESLDRLTATARKPARELERVALFPNVAPPLPARELRPVGSGDALARLSYRGEAPVSTEAPDSPEPAPRPLKSYGLGKSLARLLAGFGLFLVIAGILLPVAAFLGQYLGPLSVDVAGLPLAIIIAPIAIGLGIGMLVASQAAFAVFEQAEGLRELRGIEPSRRETLP